MVGMVIDNADLFLALQDKIKSRVPGFTIKFKDENIIQRIIGVLVALFCPGYMYSYTSTFGKTVYFPNRKFVTNDSKRAFKILAHEYVHILDRARAPIFFELLYMLPQLLAVFSILALLSLVYGPWFLLFLLALLFLLPLPAYGRAALEMRGYGMNIAVNYWLHGTIYRETRNWIADRFTGWSYYKMLPFSNVVHGWIEDYTDLIYSVNHPGDKGTILGLSDAYLDVYELITGIEE